MRFMKFRDSGGLSLAVLSPEGGCGHHYRRLFHYGQEAGGEYSSDIDFIPADHEWDSGDRPGEDVFSTGGPVPPSDFVINYEAFRKVDINTPPLTI